MAISLKSTHGIPHAPLSPKSTLAAIGTAFVHGAARAMRGVEERRVREILFSMNDRQLAAIGIDRAGIPAYAASLTTARQMGL